MADSGAVEAFLIVHIVSRFGYKHCQKLFTPCRQVLENMRQKWIYSMKQKRENLWQLAYSTDLILCCLPFGHLDDSVTPQYGQVYF